jgi:hypothetical protein
MGIGPGQDFLEKVADRSKRRVGQLRQFQSESGSA